MTSPRRYLRLGNGERVHGADRLLVDTLEPPLVTDLRLADPEVAVGHRRLDEVVASSLVTVRRAGEHVEVVGGATLLVGLLLHVKDGGGGDMAGGETTLGDGLTREGLLAKEEGVLREELLGGTEVLDGTVGGLGEYHQSVDGVEVVFVTELLFKAEPGEVVLLGRDPLGGEEERVALALVGSEPGGVGGLTEHIGGFTVGGVGSLGLEGDGGGGGDGGEGRTTGRLEGRTGYEKEKFG